MAGFLNPIGWKFTNNNGDPLNGGKISSYAGGTSTPLPIYTTQALSVAWANPAIMDAYGQAVSFISDGVSYKFVIKDSSDVTLLTVDNVSVPTVPTPTAVTDETGVIKAFGGSAAPTGYLLCDGTPVSRSTYSALFAIIGTSFGVGNGSTTFNLPDMRGRFPLGKATSGTGATIGGTGGLIDHIHAGPAHTHDAGTYAIPSGGAHTHTTGAPSASDDLQLGSGELAASPTHTHDIASSGAHTHTLSGATGSSGTGSTGTANPPYQVVGVYIIKT